jgi:predicted aspartyl protease
MITGVFVDDVPYIQVILAWGNFVKNYWFILDTGFTGDLQLPFSFSRELGLTPKSIVSVTIADGSTVQVPHALAIASMEGVVNYVQVGISNGSPLAGINFLTKFGYRAIVNCKHKTITLDKPS